MTRRSEAKLRACAVEDVAEVASLLATMIEAMQDAGGYEASPLPERVSFYKQRITARLPLPTCLFLVACVNARIVGALEASVYTRDGVFLPASSLHIHGVFVAPEHRRQGVAVALLEEAMGWGAQQGCDEVDLNVLSQNPAVELYRELGFEVVSYKMTREL